MKTQLLARAVLLASAITFPAIAQITGDIVINVTDPSNAVVAGAKVNLKSVAQGSTRSLQTDAQGVARFSLLNIGDYEVRIEAPGFASVTTSAVVNAGAVNELKTVLEISATRQEVVVESSPVAISTSNSQMQSNVESKAITQLSLPNGVLSLALPLTRK